MIAVVAALPREIAALVRGTKADAALLTRGVHLHVLRDAVVVAAGMGSARVTLAVEAALRRGGVTELVSVGLAGGCAPNAVAGLVIEAGIVIDAHTGERFESGGGDAVLVTTGSVAGVDEKARLHASYGAMMVDMEAATVGRLALAHGLKFRAIKGISDAHDFELAALNRFKTKHGHFHTRAFAAHTALRPHTWRKTMRLGRASQMALQRLTECLRVEVGQG